MHENKYRITLYDIFELKLFLTYDHPLLPNPNIDFVEIEEGKTIFIVENRSFKPQHDGGLIAVTLFGKLETGGVRSIIKLRKVKKKVNEIMNNEPRPYPVFPETLD